MQKLPMVIDHETGLPSLPSQTAVTQLGTADWYRGGSAVRHFRTGDFFLGRAAGGGVVGMADDRHVMICSGTRSGKGTSVIIPNLSTWPGSCVVIDPKGENAMVTARRRGHGSEFCEGMGQTIRVLDPFNVTRVPEEDQAQFNPLDALDPDKEESIDEAARIADALVVSEKSSDPFFDESARAFCKFVILHVRTSPDYPPDEKNLLTCRALLMEGDAKAARLAALNDPDNAPSGFALLFEAMQRNPAFNGVVARGGAMLAHMETSPRMFGSVAQVARTNTDFLDSPGMARVLSRSTFRIGELKTNPKGSSLYISLPQRYMETHARWLRLMTTLVVTEMERIEHQPVCGHPVLMVLDEFPNLRRMRVLENAAAQIAGFGVKLVFVAQTLAQLKDIYQDNWETLIANAGLKLFFCNDDYFTREYVSKSIGDREIIRTLGSINESVGMSRSSSQSQTHGISETASWSGKSASGSFSMSSSQSHSTSHGETYSQSRGLSQRALHKRALVTPDEVGRMFGNPEDMKAIALISGYQPLALHRVPYFKDEEFEGRYDWHKDHRRPPTIAATVAARAERRAARAAAHLADLHKREARAAELRRQRQNEIETAQRLERLGRSRFIKEFCVLAAIGSTVGIGLAKLWFG